MIMSQRIEASKKELENQIILESEEVKEEPRKPKKDTYHCTSTKDFTTGKERERDAGSVKPLGI